MLRCYRSSATFLLLTVKAHVHLVTHGQFRQQQHMYVGVLSKNRTKLNRSFRVILIGVGRNPERGVNNVHLISETYEDMEKMGKPQIRRFSEKSLRISTNIIYIARNLSHWPTFLPLKVLVCLYYFSCNYLWKSNPRSQKVPSWKASFRWNNRSRSFIYIILQSITRQQGIAHHHAILLALSQKFKK